MNGHQPLAAWRDGRQAAWAGALLAILLLVAATAGGQTPRAASATVARIEIKDYHFLPATLTVSPGTTVTWINRDDEPHTVTESDKAFTSPGLDEDETFSRTFSAPGTYTYFCKLHPEMTGTIIVK